MGCKVTSRPAVTPKAVTPKRAKAPETKAPAPSTSDSFEAKEKKGKAGTTYQKVETLWKEGNIASDDDWQKAN